MPRRFGPRTGAGSRHSVQIVQVRGNWLGCCIVLLLVSWESYLLQLASQLEFYFSDANLTKDKFLREALSPPCECIALTEVAKFRRWVRAWLST